MGTADVPESIKKQGYRLPVIAPTLAVLTWTFTFAACSHQSERDSSEKLAVATLKLISTCLDSYQATYGSLPEKLNQLVTARERTPKEVRDGVDLSSAEHSGCLPSSEFDSYDYYVYEYEKGTKRDRRGLAVYKLWATPKNWSGPAGRAFYMDQTNYIGSTTEHRKANENDELWVDLPQ